MNNYSPILAYYTCISTHIISIYTYYPYANYSIDVIDKTIKYKKKKLHVHACLPILASSAASSALLNHRPKNAKPPNSICAYQWRDMCVSAGNIYMGISICVCACIYIY